MTKIEFVAVCSLSALMLSGCATHEAEAPDTFGPSLREGLMAQVVPPPSRPDPQAVAPSSGARASLAQERYQQGRSIQPTASASHIGSQAGSQNTSSPNAASAASN